MPTQKTNKKIGKKERFLTKVWNCCGKRNKKNSSSFKGRSEPVLNLIQYGVLKYLPSSIISLFSKKDNEVSRQSSHTPLSSPLKGGRVSLALLTLSIFLFSAFGPSFTAFIEADNSIYQNVAAQDPQADAKAAENKEVDEMVKNIGKLASFVVSIFTPVIGIEVGMIGKLMSNDFVIGKGESAPAQLGRNGQELNINDIGQFLNFIWQIMRDLVNYAFIVVLLIIAFMTVITAGGGGESTFDIKKILPKFVIAVVLVNFTWFGAKLILDTATVATNIVYGIPNSIPGISNIGEINLVNIDKKKWNPLDKNKCRFEEKPTEGNQEGETKRKEINTCPFELFLNQMHEGKTVGSARDVLNEKKGWNTIPIDSFNDSTQFSSDVQDTVNEYVARVNKDYPNKDPVIQSFNTGINTFYVFQLFGWEDFNSSTIASLYAFSVLQIQNLPMAFGTSTDLWELTVKSIVAFLVMIVILAVFTVMFFVLLERIFIIWINIILAPFGVLMWVLKGTPLEFSAGDNKIIGLKPFLQAAFLPAILGLPLIFGLLLIIIANSATNLTIMGDVHIQNPHVLIDNITTVDQIFWYILAIGIMWYSMKLAEDMAVSEGVKAIVGSVKGGVEGVGKFIAKAPVYAPWIPIAGNKDGKGGAIADLFRMGNKLGNFHERGSDDRIRNWMNPSGAMKNISDKFRNTAKDLIRNSPDKINEGLRLLNDRQDFSISFANTGIENMKLEDQKHFLKAVREEGKTGEGGIDQKLLDHAIRTVGSPSSSTTVNITKSQLDSAKDASAKAGLLIDEFGRNDLPSKSKIQEILQKIDPDIKDDEIENISNEILNKKD